MRLLLLLLIAANAILFAVETGALGANSPAGHDPGRLTDQIDPDKVRLVALNTSGAPSSVPAPETVAAASPPPAPKAMACVEFGGFNPDESKKVEPMLANLNLGERMSQRHLEDQATYIVYLPPFKTKQDADRAAGELKRIGIPDFFVIQDAGPYHLAISLGIFHSEDAAKGLLTSLSQQGVKNAKTGERPSTISKTFYQIRPGDPALLQRLADLKTQFPNQDVHECAASGAVETAAGAIDSSRDKVATSSSGT